MLGGNFVRAIPDRARMEPAWRKIRLTVNIATKLNRSHLLPGEISYILPVIGRIEIDEQGSGPQNISMEDSTGCIHGSRGVRKPASPHLISEIRLVAEIAKASLPPNANTPWDAWTNDYALIRKSISETYPEIFYDYEKRMWEPGGFQRPLPARHREWKTATKRANFITPERLDEDADMPGCGPDTLRMITLRSNDQFNTTVYGYDDRFRGIKGTRDVLLMNTGDITRLGLEAGCKVRVETISRDNILRELEGLMIVPYDIPPGCVGAYYPEANVLLPLWHYAVGSKTPAAKSIPVAVHRQDVLF
jgi:anaerobic selenocysteine-containing dehydrogenase